MTHIQLFFATGWWWLFLLLTASCFVIAWVVYQRTTPVLPSAIRWTLVFMRWAGLTLLLLALFEPVARWIHSEIQKPRIVIAIDNSSSMAISNEREQRSKTTRNALTEVLSVLPDAELVTFSDLTQTLISPDSLRLHGKRTDLEQMVRSLSNRHGIERPSVVLVLSDGNVNAGMSPLYSAERSGIGWYTVGIGDTSQVRDLAVHTILSPGITVVNKQTEISVPVQSTGYQGVPVVVTLSEEGRVIASDSNIPKSDRDRTMAQFTWLPKQSGYKKLTVTVHGSQQEATVANNVVSEFIQVKKDQQHIAIIAGAPSPDLSFLRSELETSPSFIIDAFIQKQGATFYSSLPTEAQLATSHTIILLGFPISSTPDKLLTSIAQACSNGASLLFIPSKETDYSKLKVLDNILPFTVVSARPTESMITADVPAQSVADPLLKISGTEADADTWKNLPPIFRTEVYTRPAPGADILATIRINNVPIPEPLILRKSTGKSRSVAIMGYGLYRWKLMGSGPNSRSGKQALDAFSSLVNNSTLWLQADDKDKRVSVAPSRKFFESGETIDFTGNVYDDALTPLDDATVRVDVKRQSSTTTTVLNGLGVGRYSGNIKYLSPGDYFYSATAIKSGRTIGTDAGRFSITTSNQESGAVVQNVELLRLLANRTGAVYGNADSATTIAKAALRDYRQREKAVTLEQDKTLWHMPWPLVICIVMFASEWFLRKRYGLV